MKKLTKNMSSAAATKITKTTKTKKENTQPIVTNNIVIIDNKNRGVLCEGRDNGMGFAFLKKVDDNKYETVQPISPCKDYLAEVIFTEKYNVKTSAYGLSYPKKLNIFSDVAYMVIEMLPTKSGSYNYSSSLNDDTIMLLHNHIVIEKIINNFEESLLINIKTKIERVGLTNQYLLTFSKDWCESSHAISLYSLLIRCLMVADKEQDMLTFLENYKYNSGDKSLISACINKIRLIIENKKLPPNRRQYTLSSVNSGFQTPHDNGILSWDGKFEEIVLS